MRINKLLLSGTIAKTPEGREVGEKKTLLVTFPVAFESTGTSAEHTRQHQITCKVWGTRADIFRQLPEGTELMIDGQLQEERWKDKNGDQQRQWIVNPKDIQIVGRK